MKIDMHCHVKEGSLDSRVSMEEYIRLLQEKGLAEWSLRTMIPITATVTGKSI